MLCGITVAGIATGLAVIDVFSLPSMSKKRDQRGAVV